MRIICLARAYVIRLFSNAITSLGIVGGLFISPARGVAQDVLPTALYPVGMTQIEYFDPSDHQRPLDLMLIYPAVPVANAVTFHILLAANLHLHKDAPVVSDGLQHPLVMFSHGAGGNGSGYA
jgi:hypothetical protein